MHLGVFKCIPTNRFLIRVRQETMKALKFKRTYKEEEEEYKNGDTPGTCLSLAAGDLTGDLIGLGPLIICPEKTQISSH